MSPTTSTASHRATSGTQWGIRNLLPLRLFLFALLFIIQHVLWSDYHMRTVQDFQIGKMGSNIRALYLDSSNIPTEFAVKSKKLELAYPPMSCSKMLDDVYKKRANAVPLVQLDPNNGVANFKFTTVPNLASSQQFWLSLHDKSVDRVRWDVMRVGQYYEFELTQAILNTIKKYDPSEAMLLDVGGNIGWYSLLARSLGYEVAVFEPNPVNQLRICQSLQMNGWLQPSELTPFNLYPFGVGDNHGVTLTLQQTDEQNPGSGSFNIHEHLQGLTNATQVPIVTLDEIAIQNGWMSSDGTPTRNAKVIAFMKLDVEGFEAQVLLGARRFLKSKLVKNICLEWQRPDQNLLQNNTVSNTEKIISLLTSRLGDGIHPLFELYRMGNYRGPHERFGVVPPTDENLISALADRWGDTHVNLWFRLHEVYNPVKTILQETS